MNNRPGTNTPKQTPFAKLAQRTFSWNEINRLSNTYSNLVGIPDNIANRIIELLADMTRFFTATEVDEESSVVKSSEKRRYFFKQHIREGGIARMHQDALGSMNIMAKSLNELIAFQKETAPESTDLSDAIKYCKEFIHSRLDLLKSKKDIYFVVYKNTNPQENQLKTLLESDPAPKPGLK